MVQIRCIFSIIFFSLVFSQFDWINGGAPIRQGQHIEWQRTAGDGDEGEIIFAWSDTRDSMRDVYVQKVDSQGNKLWGENGIAVTTAYGRQEDPLLVGDDNGGAFIIWIDYRDEPDTKGDVYAQHILSDGELVWSLEGQPIVVKEGAQRSPNMCKDGNGGAYIIWKDFEEGLSENVYATHISSNNDIINPGSGVPIITNDSNHGGISLEIAGIGQAAMAWVDDRNGNLDIYGQRISADHENGTINTLWSTPEEGGKAICNVEGDQNYAKITYASGCCDTEGVTAVTWQDNRNGNFDIYMQYLLEDGTAYFQDHLQGLPLTEGLSSNQTKPRVKADESGAYVIWYSDQNLDTGSDIYAQKIIASQTDPVQWESNGYPICTAPDAQTGARLSVSGNGGAYFTWQDDRFSGDQADVYIQHISSDNQITMPENGLIVSNASLIQKSPVVRKTNDGSAFVVWEDGRKGSGSIYIQHLDSQGNLSFGDNGSEMYYGIDGRSDNIKSEKLNNGEILLYWEDREGGVNSTTTYGKILSKEYGLSYDAAISSQNTSLSLNPAQINAKVKKVDDILFMGFLQDNSQAGTLPLEAHSQFYQIIGLPDLELMGNTNGTRLNPSGDTFLYDFIDKTSQIDLVENNDNTIFYFTSMHPFFLGPDIYVNKIGVDGVDLWGGPKQITDNPSYDYYVKGAFNMPDESVFIVFSENGGGDNFGKITIMNQEGLNIDGFPIRLSNFDSDQFIESAIDTGEGIFVIWKDSRGNVGEEGGYDIYGQYFDYSGSKLGNVDGIPIATYNYDQNEAKITYNEELNEILVCWQDFSSNIDFDIFCSTINLNTLEVNQGVNGSPLYTVVEGAGDQTNIDIFKALNGNYMIVWEDSRNNSEENLQTHTDIFYQEISNGDFIFAQNGIALTDAYHIQTNPKIALYAQNESEQSYIVYWNDLRSTGKDLLYNIYAQSITHQFPLGNDDVNINDIFSIESVYPNPFNPEVNIRFFNPTYNKISISIYDLNGKLVETIYDDNLDRGIHTINWNAQYFSSGIYIARFDLGDTFISSKLSLIK